jgi:hypothetical protein
MKALEQKTVPAKATTPRMRRSGEPRRRVMKLYWCTTPDHDEDWFVVAAYEAEACIFHEREEGYGAGDADGDLACELPTRLQGTEVGWPSKDVLLACGAEFIGKNPEARIVRIGERVYGEGSTFENVAARLDSRPRQ